MMNEPVADPDLAELIERVRVHARLVARLGEALEAVRENDLDRVQELELERSELAGEPSEGAEAGAAPRDLDLLDPETLRMALETVEGYLVRERQVVENWTRIEEGSLRSAREVAHPKIAGGSYPEYAVLDNQVDLRF